MKSFLGGLEGVWVLDGSEGLSSVERHQRYRLSSAQSIEDEILPLPHLLAMDGFLCCMERQRERRRFSHEGKAAAKGRDICPAEEQLA